MRPLESCAAEQSHEDAQEIIHLLAAALVDCRVSLDLRQRLNAVKERAERIVRNTGTKP